MTNKQWLSRGIQLQAEIESLDDTIKTMQYKRRYDEETSKMYIRQVTTLIAERKQVLAEIEKAIEAVEDTAYRRILRKRYISGETVKEIAKSENYSEPHIYRVLKNGEKMIKKCEITSV